jgi:hypothetical protein
MSVYFVIPVERADDPWELTFARLMNNVGAVFGQRNRKNEDGDKSIVGLSITKELFCLGSKQNTAYQPSLQ